MTQHNEQQKRECFGSTVTKACIRFHFMSDQATLATKAKGYTKWERESTQTLVVFEGPEGADLCTFYVHAGQLRMNFEGEEDFKSKKR